MTQTHTIGRTATTIRTEDEDLVVRYHWTDVVMVRDGKMVTLNSGGYQTATTKVRMNQTANQYDLGFTVYQKNFQWFVDTAHEGTLDFYDGITFKAKRYSQ